MFGKKPMLKVKRLIKRRRFRTLLERIEITLENYVTGMDYSKAQDWIVRESTFDAEQLGKCEAIMSLGNGYMGLRSSTEEKYLKETRNLFVAGTFNKFDDSEVTELPNVADVVGMDLIINGQHFSLEQGEILFYERELNLKTGELVRNVTWRSPLGDEVEFVFRRIVSFDDLHIIAQSISLKAVNHDLKIKIRTGMNGRVSNSGSQHFSEGPKRLYDMKYLQYNQTTGQSKIHFVLTSCVLFFDDTHQPINMDITPFMERRTLEGEYTGLIEVGKTLVMEKVTDVRTSRDKEHEHLEEGDLAKSGLTSCKVSSAKGYQELAKESATAWNNRVWSKIPVTIKSKDPFDQLAIRFAQYHLHIMTPAHDNRMNIGAKGLSGEGYKGHTFWDTEIFTLPYFTFSAPDTARKLAEYRYLSIPGAHKKAKDNGYEGAQFPWESAWLDDGEVTPVWGAADIVTGLPIRIWSGDLEQHITSDVAFGVWQYYKVTGDQDFMNRYGYELIMDTAKFWVSRLETSDTDDLYHINNVMGPDEYKEHIDDNAFTNYMAYWNIKKAIEYYQELEGSNPALLSAISEKLELHRVYLDWINKVEKIFHPEPDEHNLIAQDSTYMSLKQIDLTKYKNQDKVGSIFFDYNLDQINEIQVSKQADILILFLLLEDQFSHEVKWANFKFYEPRTLHDSSLSLSTHVILANDLGDQTLAYNLFKKAREIDLGPRMNTSNDGIHAASIAGIWQSTVFGFGGVRMLDGKLRIEPSLPETWTEISFTIFWHGQELHITVTHENFTVVNVTKTEAITFVHHGESIEVHDTVTIHLNRPC